MRPWLWCRRVVVGPLLLAGLALAGCAGMPERLSAGASRADIVAALGPPTAEYRLDAGVRLQYSRQPAGQHVFNLDLDADGRLLQRDQVMALPWFDRIGSDRWTRDDVMRTFGRPALVERVARFRGDVWTYRYLDNGIARQAHVHIDPAGIVRRVMHTDEPMPDDWAGPAR
jgi:hypothetical protein